VTPPDPRAFPRQPRTALYAGLGFAVGLTLTCVGYVVDYYALYDVLPKRLDLELIRGLHRVTPVHYFMDGFAPLLAAVGAVLGYLQDKVVFYTSHLEDLVAARTHDLKASRERYELAARGANDGLWDWDLVKHRVYFSPRWKQALGHGEEEIGEGPEEWLDRVHPDDRAGLEARIRGHLAGASEHLIAEYRLRHADGSHRWKLSRGLAVREPGTERATRMAGSQTDIDEQKRMEEQLRRLALQDPLTGLPNRTLFLDRLGRALARARRRRRSESVAIVFVDIDQFKTINDSLGHVVGDHILKATAERIRACLERVIGGLRLDGYGDSDDEAAGPGSERRFFSWTLARMGGDEFIVLLDDIRSLRDASQVVRALEEDFRQPLQAEGRDLFVTLSTGIVLGPGTYERSEDLLRDADTAMYRAKAAGRGRFEIFDEKMLARAQEQLRLETDLHQALQRDEFHVVYQPIVELQSGRLRGFEALLRWRHPERGLVPPAKFIPLAEEIGLIVPLGRLMLTEACRQLRHWHDLDPAFRGLSLATNLSLRQIVTPELEDEVVTLVREAGLDPTLLYFEITENTLIDHPKQVTRVLTRLKRRGFRVAIDDFGTGYSSLAVLQSLPVDILKIDQVFVKQMGESEKARQIIGTIVSLAHGLDHEVIAEGIENEDQAKELRRLHCTLGQGFFFSPALEGDKVEAEVLTRTTVAPHGKAGRAA
jgi:PAS domain S-box-containing protein